MTDGWFLVEEELPKAIRPEIGGFAEAARCDEERRGELGIGEDIPSGETVRVPVVERDRDLPLATSHLPKRHDVAPSAKDLALLSEPVRAHRQTEWIVGDARHPVVEEYERSADASHRGSSAFRACPATMRGNSGSTTRSSSARSSEAANPYRNAEHDRTLP